MSDFSRTFEHLNEAAIGVFGAGHLGRVIAEGLVKNAFPISRLLICHGRSPQTRDGLVDLGLSERIVEARELTRRSKIVLYLVRPQSLKAIKGCELPFGTLIVSFLAGTTLAALASVVSAGDIVRVVPSSPDTIVKRTAIAGVFPAGNLIVEELLRGLSIRQLYLAREEDMHAFTALGVCLPMALVCWSARGNTVDDANLKDCAKRYGLGN